MKNCFGHGRIKTILYAKLKNKNYYTEMAELFLLLKQ